MNQLDTIKQQLAALIASPSVSSADAKLDMGNREVVDHLSNWFADRGFRVEQQPVGSSGGKCNMVATLGQGADGLVLSGHTDTVPYDGRSWSTDPFTLAEREGRYFGLGTADMKGFFPAVLAALDRLEPTALKAPLTVLATADEETSMAGARELLAQRPQIGRYGLIGEPTSLVPVHMHKGVAWLAVEITGRSGHASDPALGNNAIDGMQRVLGALAEWRIALAAEHSNSDFHVPQPTLNFGALKGGDNPNRICASCELLLDLRYLPGMDVAAVLESFNATITGALAGSGLRSAVRELMQPVPAYQGPADGAAVRLAETLTGRRAAAVAFATEAPFLAGLGVETVILGPGNIEQAHQPDEYVAAAPLLQMVGIVEHFIERFCLT